MKTNVCPPVTYPAAPAELQRGDFLLIVIKEVVIHTVGEGLAVTAVRLVFANTFLSDKAPAPSGKDKFPSSWRYIARKVHVSGDP